jgi:hypothetical protein
VDDFIALSSGSSLGWHRGRTTKYTELVIAKELRLGDETHMKLAQGLNAEVGRMLTAFIATVSEKTKS